MVSRQSVFGERMGFCMGFSPQVRNSKKRKSPETLQFLGILLELLSRFELETSSLPRMRSTD